MRSHRSLQLAFMLAALAQQKVSLAVPPARDPAKAPRKFTDARIADAEAKRQRRNARRAALAQKGERNG